MDNNADKQEKKMSMPPLPPGFMKPASPPPLPGQGKPALPPMPGGAQTFPFTQPSAPAGARPAPQRDAAAEETARMKEDKDKLEKKIAEMEKVVAQEKEKALLATLKGQQDEVLSSKVESSLKDIQEKLRRDRREQEMQEERLTLKAKAKELESRLVSERETWMQTLKGQIQERETQSKDVEGHFIYRLQEMERRWLEEKAQWQRTISRQEDEIRSLKSSEEKLRELQEEFRRAALEKEMQTREMAKLKDEVNKVEREKAAVEANIRNLPEREREFADLKVENAVLRAREEKAHNEVKLAEEKFRYEAEKFQKEIGRLQSDIGSLSDRKNAEKDEELQKARLRHEDQLHERDKMVADISGDKLRALSELVKMKSFVSRVQAINAALEKERQALRLEKLQLAQAMAANIEDVKKIKAEMELHRASRQAELQKCKNDCFTEAQEALAAKTAELERRHQADLAAAGRKGREELEDLKAEAAKDFENKALELRSKYEAAAKDMRAGLRKEAEQACAGELELLKASKTQADKDRERFAEEARNFSAQLALARKESADVKAQIVEKQRRLEEQINSLPALKKDYERRIAALEAERGGLGAELARLGAEHASVKARLDAAIAAKSSSEQESSALARSLKAESENRGRLETELSALKQALQQLELQLQSEARRFEEERQSLSLANEEALRRIQSEQETLAAVSAELETYKQLENSFAERMKWALKGSHAAK
jgi:chromosome segregation ATPase